MESVSVPWKYGRNFKKRERNVLTIMDQEYEKFHKHVFKRSIDIRALYTVFYNKMINNYASQGEKHDFYELIYVDTGEIWVTLEDTHFRLSKGECYLHPPNQFHRHSVDKKKESSVCIVSFFCRSALLKKLADKVLTLNKNQVEKISEIMYYASHIFESIVEKEDVFVFVKYHKYPAALEQLFLNTLENLFLDIHMYECTPVMEEKFYIHVQGEDQMIDLIKKYMADHVAKKISISEMCRHFSYGKTSLSQKFKACTGKTIMQYFNELKVEEAAFLLENTQLTITDIACRLNFSNASYFSTVFKQYMGMYPRDYKKSLVKEKNIKFLYREN